MKKVLVVLTACILAVALAGCSQPVKMSDEQIIAAAEEILANQGKVIIDESELEDREDTADTADEDLQNEPEEAATPEPQDDATPAPEEVGTRQNPAGIGESMYGTMDSFSYGHCDMEMKLLEVIKGDDAWAMVKEGNQFNEEPEEGKEYIAAKFYVKNLADLSGEDEALEINSAQFDYANSMDIVDDDQWCTVSGVEPDLDCELYEGVEYEGWVFFFADIGEENPKAVFMDEFWFDLSGGAAE
jgi:hypothetical protein